MKGYLMQVQPFSVNDGEGIRTTVFWLDALCIVSGAPIQKGWIKI